jgi:DnaJ-class molecular chaperone
MVPTPDQSGPPATPQTTRLRMRCRSCGHGVGAIVPARCAKCHGAVFERVEEAKQ